MGLRSIHASAIENVTIRPAEIEFIAVAPRIPETHGSKEKEDMRVLITGAAGYVGSILIKASESNADIDEIVCVDLKPKPDPLAASAKVAWIQADVSPTTGRPQRATIT